MYLVLILLMGKNPGAAQLKVKSKTTVSLTIQRYSSEIISVSKDIFQSPFPYRKVPHVCIVFVIQMVVMAQQAEMELAIAVLVEMEKIVS